jgi:hypothetical protein
MVFHALFLFLQWDCIPAAAREAMLREHGRNLPFTLTVPHFISNLFPRSLHYHNSCRLTHSWPLV